MALESRGHCLKSLRTRPPKELLRTMIAARKKAGLTQHELSVRPVRHQSFVAKYETGEPRVEVIEFPHICKTLGARADKLLRGLP